MTLRIVADENMPNVEAWFSSADTQLTRLPGRTLTRDDVRNADVLLVRSVTRVDEALIHDTPIALVGSATIGTDHIDKAYLSRRNIPFYHAPGCNARSVADWLLSVFSRLHLDHDVPWWDQTIGIVGVGNVGSEVRATLEAIGCRVLVCDPIRHERGQLNEHCPLDDLLSNADIVCFHTPHTTVGVHATHHLLNEHRVQKLRRGGWLINAGRGPVFDASAVASAMALRETRVVLDVWPEEPHVPSELLDNVELASPHVAGYSLEGKYRGTEVLARAVQSWAGWSELQGPPMPERLVLDAQAYRQTDLNAWISQLILAVYDPARDTVAMRASVREGAIPPALFDELRKSYPVRRELGSVRIDGAPLNLMERLAAFGFSV